MCRKIRCDGKSWNFFGFRFELNKALLLDQGRSAGVEFFRTLLRRRSIYAAYLTRSTIVGAVGRYTRPNDWTTCMPVQVALHICMPNNACRCCLAPLHMHADAEHVVARCGCPCGRVVPVPPAAFFASHAHDRAWPTIVSPGLAGLGATATLLWSGKYIIWSRRPVDAGGVQLRQQVDCLQEQSSLSVCGFRES